MDANDPDAAIFQLILLLVLLIPAILFLLTEYNTVRAVRTENRLIKPGLIWVQLIPFIGQIWQFLVVTYIADSIRKEFGSRNVDSILGVADADAIEELGKRPTYGVGIAYCSFNVLTILINMFGSGKGLQLQLFAAFTAIASIVCWIIYWVQLSMYKRKLKALPPVE